MKIIAMINKAADGPVLLVMLINLFILMLVMLLCAGCGSMKKTKWAFGPMTYEQEYEIYPRVYIMDTTCLGIDLSYNPEVKLPNLRLGLIRNLWYVNTVRNSSNSYYYSIDVPWLFTLSNNFNVINTPESVRIRELELINGLP